MIVAVIVAVRRDSESNYLHKYRLIENKPIYGQSSSHPIQTLGTSRNGGPAAKHRRYRQLGQSSVIARQKERASVSYVIPGKKTCSYTWSSTTEFLFSATNSAAQMFV